MREQVAFIATHAGGYHKWVWGRYDTSENTYIAPQMTKCLSIQEMHVQSLVLSHTKHMKSTKHWAWMEHIYRVPLSGQIIKWFRSQQIIHNPDSTRKRVVEVFLSALPKELLQSIVTGMYVWPTIHSKNVQHGPIISVPCEKAALYTGQMNSITNSVH